MMFLKTVKEFLSILNSDALLFLGTRVGSIILSLTSIVLLCRAVTAQAHFMTDGLGHIYDLMPMGPLAYTLIWSIVSLVLPGCHRKYHPALDMGLDFIGLALSFAAGGALLSWSMHDQYETGVCFDSSPAECDSAAQILSSTEKSSAVLLILTGLTHLIMFVRATRAVWAKKKQYVPSRNSWMQLEKGSDQHLEISSLASSEQSREQGVKSQKQSTDGSDASPV